MPDAATVPSLDEIATLVKAQVAEVTTTLSAKFEKDIAGLRSSYDTNFATLRKAMTDSPGKTPEFDQELSKVEKERAEQTFVTTLEQRLKERDELWTAKLEAKTLGLPDDLVATFTTPAQLKATVALVKHLSGDKKKPQAAGAGPGGRAAGAGEKPNPITELASRLEDPSGT